MEIILKEDIIGLGFKNDIVWLRPQLPHSSGKGCDCFSVS